MMRMVLLLMISGLVGCASTRGSAPRHSRPPWEAPGIPRTELRGRILDPEGKGVEGLRVSIDPANDKEWVSWGYITGRDGSYRIRVAPGRYHIQLSPFYQRVWEVDLDTIDVPISGARLDYQYRGVKIWGHVRGHGGRLPKGDIHMVGNLDGDESVSTSGELIHGTYTVFVPRGRYLMEWELRPPFPSVETMPRSFTVSSDTMIDLSLPWEEVHGQIRVGGIESSWEAGTMGTFTGRDTLHIGGRIRVDSHGRYSAYLPAGEYQFQVGGGRRNQWIFPQWFNQRVPATEAIKTDLHAVNWTGTVRDSATGASLDSIWVSASDSRNFGYCAAVTDKKGRFRLLMDAGRIYTMNFWDSYRRRGRLGYRLANVIAAEDTVFDVRVAKAR